MAIHHARHAAIAPAFPGTNYPAQPQKALLGLEKPVPQAHAPVCDKTGGWTFKPQAPHGIISSALRKHVGPRAPLGASPRSLCHATKATTAVKHTAIGFRLLERGVRTASFTSPEAFPLTA
uniref:Uncharacterized protein n=1 Tax=Eutreptiella gymnastica TaxID=73025 RepID=A0A7S4LJ10_9EUGL